MPKINPKKYFKTPKSSRSPISKKSLKSLTITSKKANNSIKHNKVIQQFISVTLVIFTPEFDNEKQHQSLIKKLGNTLL